MAVNLNAVSIFNSAALPTAPLIEGGAFSALFNENPPRGENITNLVGRYGMRVTLPSAISFSGYDYVSIYFTSRRNPKLSLASVASGGIRLIFIDAAGNYAGYNIYGDIAGLPAYSGKEDGWIDSYSTVNTTFNIAIGRSPDISQGVINWGNITAFEYTITSTSPQQKDGALGRITKRSAPIVTGSETFKSIFAATKAATSALLDPLLTSAASIYLGGAAQSLYGTRIGLTIGDGVAVTNFTESNFALGFENPFEFFPSYPSVGPWTQLADSRKRELRINQSPADVLSLTDGSIASAGWWQWVLLGSGSALCTRVQFWRFNGFKAAHGHYTDCAWNDADTAVEVTAATVITGGLIRGAKTTALKVLSGAGVYADLAVQINSPAATYDIELGSGGAGTYELPHITVPAGRTLRVRNNSASNAIVVVLPPGTLYSATTAGGSITVVSAGTKLTITDLPPGCDAVVLTAGTSTVLAQADELPGATFVFEYTGAPVVDIGIFKPGYKPRYLRNLQLAATDSAIPVSLEIDRSYLP